MKKLNKKDIKVLIKNNKYTIIVLVCFIVLFFLTFIGYKLFFPDSGKPVYGDRLDGINEVKLTKSDLQDLEDELKKKDFVEDAKVTISGKIIKPIITVKEKTSVNDAKGLTDIVLKYFEKEYVEYYDIEIFIKCSGEDNNYPIIGYKSHTAKTFSY